MTLAVALALLQLTLPADEFTIHRLTPTGEPAPFTIHRLTPAAQAPPARPCDSAKYRELDFWIGEWEARGANAPAGKPPASSVITKVHGGCVILETWTGENYTGQSFNIYDRVRGQWHQTWVDSSGGLQEFWGSLKDGNMVYEGTVNAPAGKPAVTVRMTFFNLGRDRVRQLVEHSANGKTWEVKYDFLYTRKA